MADPDLTPEALKRLVDAIADELTPETYERYLKLWDRWRSNIIGGDRSDGPRMGFESVMDAKNEVTTEAAAAISALMAERDALAQIAGERLIEMESMNRQTHNAFDRAERAEARLREIAGIAVPPGDMGSDWHSEAIMLGEKLDRIATIARSTSQGGEG